VDPKLFEEVGAVSEPVVRVMAENVRKLMGTELGIAISGIAGPSGGTEEKPVGTVWIAVSSPAGTLSKRFQLGQFRERVIREAAQHALAMTRRILLAEPEPEN
ncbi:MAG: CinA family protein, partial [Bacteroidota bacterium]